MYKNIEHIIDDTISELDKVSYNSDIEYDPDNDSYYNDKESYISNELQEDII